MGRGSSFTFGHDHLARKILDVLGRFQKYDGKGHGISRRNFEGLERLEALQMGNVFQCHASENFLRHGVAPPNVLILEFLPVLIEKLAAKLNFPNNDRILIERDAANQKNFAVSLYRLVAGAQ